MATAFAEECQQIVQSAGNVDAMLLKPFSLAELREAIDVALPRPNSVTNNHSTFTARPPSTPGLIRSPAP
jgi:DNA-binding response OmpR family regulator